MARFELERINSLWFLTLGITALAAGVLIYILLLESAFGAFSITAASPNARAKQEQPRVALLSSEHTRQAHARLSGTGDATEWIDLTLRSWRAFLLDETRNISFSEITDADIEAGKLDAFDTLILPSVRAMSDEEVEQIKAFMEAGGSVFATWTPGIYRPDGSWRGWHFIEEAFGVAFVDFVDRATGDYRIYQDTFPGHTPPGLYRPERFSGGSASGDSSGRREQMQQQAAEADFPPLRGYRWSGEPHDPSPQTDYATADTMTLLIRGVDGERRRQRAVAVTYYTWTGGTAETQTPYPYTRAGIHRFTLRGNTPLTANIPPGYRVKVQIYNPAVRMRVLDPRTIPAGFWYDFAVEDRVMGEALATTTGIVYGTYGKGRFVYMGFQRDAMGIGPEDGEEDFMLGTFFTNVMSYLRREPVVWVRAWPHPYDAAALLTGIGGKEIKNFAGTADILAEEEATGTFFIRPEGAAENRSLLYRLHASGDVGVLGDPPRDGEGSERVQRERLARLRQALEDVVGTTVTGYRSTRRGMLSESTMGALKEAGYHYIVSDSIGRRMLPKIMGFPYETLTRIGVTARSDREIFERTAGESQELRSLFFQEDVTRVAYEGGTYNLIYSSDLLARPENREILRGVVRALKRQNFWVASGDEITHWWRLHHGLHVDIEQRGPHRIVMRVSNNNGATAEEMAVTIALGRAVTGVRIRPELVGVPTPAPLLRARNTELVLQVEKLKPQQSRTFHIDLVDEEASRMLTRN